MDFEALPTKDVAYHMTLFDWDLFWAVHEYELLYHTFGRHHFNKVSAFKFDFVCRKSGMQPTTGLNDSRKTGPCQEAENISQKCTFLLFVSSC